MKIPKYLISSSYTYLECHQEVAELRSVVAPAGEHVDAVAGEGEAAAGGAHAHPAITFQ